MEQYKVTIRKSYLTMSFVFTDMEQAWIFVQTALTKYQKDEDDRKKDERLSVNISLVDDEDEEEED